MPHLSLPLAALAGAFGALLVAAFGILLGGAFLRFRARRLGVAARRSLGEARGDLEGHGEDDAAVTLTGTLESLGGECARFEDGASVAIATAAGEFFSPGSPPALTVRAERLRLKMRDGVVEIVGPVQVLGGARESRPGGYQELGAQPRRRLREAAEGGPVPAGDLELRSLCAGDRVRVSGVLSRVEDAQGANGYREAAPYMLVASPAAQAVVVAFEGAPRASGPVVAALAGVRARQDLFASAALVFVLGAALGFGARVVFAREPAAQAAVRTPQRLFGERERCRELKEAYAAALARSATCAREEDCGVELRGEQYFGLDGCFRLKNLRAPTAEADRIAQQWLDERCVERYEVCSVQPLTACRQGQCVERPPPTLPGDWVRHEFADLWTFFAPPDVQTTVAHPDCGFAELLEVWREDFQLHFDFDARWDEGAPAPEAISGGEELRIGELVARVTRREIAPGERGYPKFTQSFGASIADAGECPPFCTRFYHGPGRILIHGTCRDRAACDEALRVVQSLRPW